MGRCKLSAVSNWQACSALNLNKEPLSASLFRRGRILQRLITKPQKMTTLFDTTTAGDITLANRIVMAPLTRNRSPNAIPTALVAQYYAQRATAGLIITEATAISAQAQGYADVPGLYGHEQIAAWKTVTSAVHEKGGRIVSQLWHVGRVSHTDLQPNHAAPVAPSAIQAKAKTVLLRDGKPVPTDTSMPRALATDELAGIVQDYRRAARAAMDAGFDGVEIHAANGYLLDQFMRDGTNHRTDAYGGSIENRIRFVLEVVRAVADEVGAGRTGIRISPVAPFNDMHDSQPQALFTLLIEQLGQLGQLETQSKAGLAYIHVIEGATGGQRVVDGAAFDYTALKSAYRKAGGKGAWMVNNGYDHAMADKAVANVQEGADLVAFGRPFIANPDLVARIQKNAPWNPLDGDTLYGGGAKGYTDYPTLD
jgi:N-ethylmaleimide reductase